MLNWFRNSRNNRNNSNNTTGATVWSPNVHGYGPDLSGNFQRPTLRYDKLRGIQYGNSNFGKTLNTMNLAGQAMSAAEGLSNLSKTTSSTDDIVSDIIVAAQNSPTLAYDLTPDQLQLLRQLQRGTYDTDASLSDVNASGAIGNAIKGAMMGIGGGRYGMLIGGLGGLVNSGIGDMQSGAARRNSELEALYAALVEAQRNHNSVLRDRAYARI